MGRYYSNQTHSNNEFSNQLPTLHEQNYHKLDARRRKLLYRSKERGMLETDLLLGTFALKYLHTLNDTQLEQFEALLDAIDPDIYQVNNTIAIPKVLNSNYSVQWITKKVEPPPDYDNEILKMVQDHLETNPLGYVSTYAQTQD